MKQMVFAKNSKTVRQQALSFLLICFLLFYVFTFLMHPGECFTCAAQSLLLWFQRLLPSLLPFLILSNLIVATGFHKKLCKFLYPPMHLLFGISYYACYPLAIGLLSGVPLGAAAVSDLYGRQLLKKKEAQLLLCFCNHPAPLFFIVYLGTSLFAMPKPHLLYLLFLAVLLFCGIVTRIVALLIINKQKKGSEKDFSPAVQVYQAEFQEKHQKESFVRLFDGCIMKSAETMVKIGGYVLMFRLFTTELLCVFSDLCNLFPQLAEKKHLLLVACAVAEISSGAALLAESTYFLPQIKTALILSLTAFGGISFLMQTQSVMQSSGLSVRFYFLGKLILGIICFFVYRMFFS